MAEPRFDAARAFGGWAMSPDDRARLPYYDHLLNTLADSSVARDLLVEVRATQRNPMLVLAALHYRALRGDAVLAALYRSIGEATPVAFAAGVVARLEEEPSIVRDELHRSTQTNEPGRSAVLAAVLRELRTRGAHDVHLIDVGTSMGLNLYPDLYRVNVDDGDPAALSMEDWDGTVSDGELPRVHQRIGLDLHPLDPEDPDDVLWLRACLWPEEQHRSARLDAILARLAAWPRATRLRGTALDLIDGAVASCSTDATPVIFHSWVAGYFSRDDQEQWHERMIRHVARGACWVYFEHPEIVAGLAPPAPSAPAPREGAAQIVVAEPRGEPAAWGWAHPHGRWIALHPQ